MSRYIHTESKFGSFKTIILKDTLSGSSVEIALRGATLLNFFIPLKNKLFNIIDGYQTPKELEEQSGARSCIMAPFSNRIEGGFYEFDDAQHQMYNPVNPQREAIHGFARVIDFEVKKVTTDEHKAELILFTNKLRKDAFKGYPYAVDVEVKFVLKDNELHVDITGHNKGTEAAPFGSGWHPYFKTSDEGVDHLVLTIPASSVIIVDEKLIPLSGEDAYLPISEMPEADFRPSKDIYQNTIGDREVNYCYADLQAGSDGIIRSTIRDPKNGLKITVFQKGGVFYAYSADEVKYRPRMSIALEPVQYITNSFNRPELKDKMTLKPGCSVTFSFGVITEVQK
ncbi:MAG: aldose 1-epimerase [Bacteroidota bacterium]|nr:aldose 1-epimerase [Ignavibacteria bacterium]MCU7498058.1 aldose 1-epimerase [Ignavibacteria bacterium]MCU7512118.1 aldose 1-epimerase [Ignavibacteria bacterium]MCU7520423.1 aldose 1-epimerase [Ignavibacteria bacterium]MCU7523896.1 aldose 1-epimerase [Ignavibacteria bacterium]